MTELLWYDFTDLPVRTSCARVAARDPAPRRGVPAARRTAAASPAGRADAAAVADVQDACLVTVLIGFSRAPC